MSYEERCYVVSGSGFQALKIRGLSHKKKLLEYLKGKGFSPRGYQVNCNASGYASGNALLSSVLYSKH